MSIFQLYIGAYGFSSSSNFLPHIRDIHNQMKIQSNY